MKIVKLNSDRKIINYSPIINGKYKTTEDIYEFSKNRKLEVDTVYMNSKKYVQNKTLTQNGKNLKEIIVKFADGIRKKIIRIS